MRVRGVRISLNRNDLIEKMNETSSVVLREKGYISFVYVLTWMGKLSKEDYDAWRFRQVPCLERVIKVILLRINVMFPRALIRVTGRYVANA